jgi:hypothetical protein
LLIGHVVDRPCCCEVVVALRSERHCARAQFVSCVRRFQGPKQVMSAIWGGPAIAQTVRQLVWKGADALNPAVT